MSYDTFRHLADTWGLVALAAIFVLLIVWIFRRGSTKKYQDAARIPMDAPEHPEARRPSDQPTTAERDRARQQGDET